MKPPVFHSPVESFSVSIPEPGLTSAIQNISIAEEFPSSKVQRIKLVLNSLKERIHIKTSSMKSTFNLITENLSFVSEREYNPPNYNSWKLNIKELFSPPLDRLTPLKEGIHSTLWNNENLKLDSIKNQLLDNHLAEPMANSKYYSNLLDEKRSLRFDSKDLHQIEGKASPYFAKIESLKSTKKEISDCFENDAIQVFITQQEVPLNLNFVLIQMLEDFQSIYLAVNFARTIMLNFQTKWDSTSLNTLILETLYKEIINFTSDLALIYDFFHKSRDNFYRLPWITQGKLFLENIEEFLGLMNLYLIYIQGNLSKLLNYDTYENTQLEEVKGIIDTKVTQFVDTSNDLEELLVSFFKYFERLPSSQT
ncbi:hypothetical protein HYPBUDRAFT_150584 [Hyphopichia burtonii NRRL Y-1933]|uniref:Uncharacterized protein n=1 Tax=Hyphopichia burtonii NRRL Y-1933 TaxID=984485 RepID=A0A1E4RD90_9ASCO|nr:hypothetical protein HYPBUDRAFT_150584 [Hyphopichia burtonii NRRL Y-1933]ODV65212.1 hypothetical protein HYPBUDRAFT_150584 [Hyphopichia burtonii NRRL Y-1933]